MTPRATPVTVQAFGVVAKLAVRAGDRVDANQEIARIEAKDLSSVVERSAREVALLREETNKAELATKTLHESALAALRNKSALLSRRATTKQAQVQARRAHAAKLQALAGRRLIVEDEWLRADEAAAAANEELLLLREQVAQIELELAERQYSFASQRVDREFQVRKAEAGLAEAEARAVLSQVRAAEAGRVESLLVTEGQVVQAGAVVAQIVPDGRAYSAVVFAPAKDAAFLQPGLSAVLELPSLPVSEFGRARATISRVGSHDALPAEVAAVLGSNGRIDGPVRRVEVAIVDDATWRRMKPRASSGAEVVARLKTRQRRIFSLLFDVLR